MFGSEDRYQYIAPPLIEVICQLRFPAILSIAAQDPAAFQERIRGSTPSTPSARTRWRPGW